MADVITDYKEYVEKLVKKFHLEQMTPDVKKRFDTYVKNKDFIGDMKNWEKELNADIVLDDKSYETAYKAFLAVFENMSENTKDLNKKVKEQIFDKVFGDKLLFNHPEPIPGVKEQLDDFADKILTDKNKQHLTKAIEEYPYIARLFDDGKFDFDKFKKNIKDEKYKNDPKTRKQILEVLDFVRSYSASIFPDGSAAQNYQFDKFGLPYKTEDWFVAHYNPGFKVMLPHLVKQLTVNSKFRDEFKKYDSAGTISGKVDKGLEKTAYDDPKSDDFVPPVYEDEKKFGQKVSDALNKFEENNLDSWGRILTLRGTRRFFSPYSKTVIEAICKVKTKDKKPINPIDGIKGILDNKDAIIAKVLEASPNAKKQFEWFVKKMETYSKKMPKAFEGALHNSKQMRAIVSQMIVEAIHSGKDDDIAAAKTSMEILSTMKYGVFHSRTMTALGKGEFSLVGKKDLSWNKKYEVVQATTKFMDWTAKMALLGVGRGIAAIRNGVFNKRTKFNGNMKRINKAHAQWEKNVSSADLDNLSQNFDTEIAANQAKLPTLEAQVNKYGDKSKLEKSVSRALKQKADREESLEEALEKLEELQNSGTPVLPNVMDNLRKQIQNDKRWLAELQKKQDLLQEYTQTLNNIDSLTTQKNSVDNDISNLKGANPDKYLELMAFWDMLESHWKSHQFALSAKFMRNKFLENYKDGTSKAQVMQIDFAEAYKQKYSKVA